jgi:hypothetical protein
MTTTQPTRRANVARHTLLLTAGALLAGAGSPATVQNEAFEVSSTKVGPG